MKTKTAHFFAMAMLMLLSNEAFSQLRIDPYGRIGMGTNYPNPEFKCHIKGNLLLTTYPEIPPPNTVHVELRMKLGNGWPGVEIGSNIDKIAFWYAGTGYNILYAEQFYTQSDSTTKTNIARVENGIEKINKLESFSYKMKDDKRKRIRYGFLAQEVAKVFPEMTDSAKGILLVDYNQIIPLLVSAAKEQNILIESLKQELKGIKNDLLNCCNQQQSPKKSTTDTNNQAQEMTTSISNFTSPGVSQLFQNRPNPFREITKIEFEIVEKYTTASILVFDMQGTLKKTIRISGSGKGEIAVNGYELTAGMYLYSLIVDDKEIDTKRMILVN